MSIREDLRYGWRLMVKNPRFTSVAVLTIAIGVGITGAVFSLVNGVLLRPLPYPNPDQLVRVMDSYPEKGLDVWRLSQALLARFRDENRVFSSIAAYTSTGVNLTTREKPERLFAAKVTADFFKVLGVNPLFGRDFTPQDDVRGKNTVCILSYGFWQRRFGGSHDVIGRSLTLNNVSTEIVGVMPASMGYPTPETELWIPLGLDPQAAHPYFLTGIARLRPGVPMSTAEAETSGILLSAGQQNPNLVGRNDPPPPGSHLKTRVEPLKEVMVGKVEKPLLSLQFAALFILLITCANVANLLLSRSTWRSREVVVRYALGSTRRRIMQQLLTESTLLAFVGALPGIALAWLAIGLLSKLPLEGIPRISEVGMDWAVLAFTVVVSMLTGLLFGLFPAWKMQRQGIREGLNEGAARGAAKGSVRGMNGMLVSVQLALSLMLLVGAGVMLKSLQQLLRVDPGFQSQHLLTLLLPATNQKYPKPEQAVQFYQTLIQNLNNVPGVTSAAITSNIPFSGEEDSDGYLVEGHDLAPGSDAPQAQLQVVSPGYFNAMGMTLQQGRDFSPNDKIGTPLAVVVDDTLAKSNWVGDALVKRVRLTGDPPWFTVVGVVNAVKDDNLAAEARPHMYFAYAQYSQMRMYVVVRTAVDPVTAMSAVTEQVHQLDPDIPVFAMRTMDQVINRTLNTQKLTEILFVTFAVLALLLAAIGIYGVMSVYVSSRIREFGIRLALGAAPANLMRSVLREALFLIFAGAVVGILGTVALGQVLASLLYRVSPVDPVTMVTVTFLLVSIALLACYWPARRASRTNPMVALRYE